VVQHFSCHTQIQDWANDFNMSQTTKSRSPLGVVEVFNTTKYATGKMHSNCQAKGLIMHSNESCLSQSPKALMV
jgi:hypothetical protein